MKSFLIICLVSFFSLEPIGATSTAAFTLKTEGESKNFIFEQDAKALVSSIDFVIRTGNLSDPEGKEGLAMLAFSSLLRGTKKKNRNAFDSEMEKLGAAISVDTASNRTIVNLDSINENLEAAIQLLAEAILQPKLDEAEFASLKVEVLAALKQERSNNRALLKRAFRRASFQGSGLADPPQGTLSSIAKIQKEDVIQFLSEHIKSGKIVIAVNSNLSEEKVKSWIENAFKNLPTGGSVTSANVKENKAKGKQLILVERPGSATTEVGIGHFGITAQKNDREALELGLFIFGGDMSSRLFQELRGKNGWTYGAHATFQMLEIPRNHGGAFMIYTFPHAEHTSKAVAKSLSMYSDYVKKGITEKELQFAKNTLKNSYPFQFASSRAKLTGRLYEFLDGAPLLSVDEYRKAVDQFSKNSLLKSIQAAHDSENLWIVLVGDPKALDQTQKTIKGIKGVKRYTPEELIP
jgi:zinc protease